MTIGSSSKQKTPEIWPSPSQMCQAGLLYTSPLGNVVDYRCTAEDASLPHAEYNATHTVSLVRRGEFEYAAGSKRFDVYAGHVLVEAPGQEYRVRHPRRVRDECTSFQFHSGFVERAMDERPAAPVFPSVRPGSARLDYLHATAVHAARHERPSLAVDSVLVAIFEEVFQSALSPPEPPAPERRERQRHAESVDRAKRFVMDNFQRDVTLDELARSAFVSVFHFARVFRRLTGLSPYRYLIEVRLAHAALLLRCTSLSVTEICFDSGFNSLEHFTSTFTRRFSANPSAYRRM